MDPVTAAILSLAGIVISTFGPLLVKLATAAIAGTDAVAAVAQEDVGDILPAVTHVDEAMAFAHAHEAAAKLKMHDALGDIAMADLTPAQLATVVSAMALHDLVLATQESPHDTRKLPAQP